MQSTMQECIEFLNFKISNRFVCCENVVTSFFPIFCDTIQVRDNDDDFNQRGDKCKKMKSLNKKQNQFSNLRKRKKMENIVTHVQQSVTIAINQSQYIVSHFYFRFQIDQVT